MATAFVETRAASPAAAPFLRARPNVQPDFAAALEAAVVSERASQDVRRNTRCRVSFLLCEVANQLRQQTGSAEIATEFPLSRFDLAELLGVSLTKVKRVLALLSLSGAVSTDGRSIEVRDWRRLCGVARVDPARLGLFEEDMDIAARADKNEPASLVTASGEPACFV